ncbi:putative Der GTPase activator|nr:putative Der GTPase activator [Candidatus Pantoea persica]
MAESAPVSKPEKKAAKPAVEKVRFSPEEELAQLENSERLDALLDRYRERRNAVGGRAGLAG